MLGANFWARSLQQIVAQKVKYKRSESGQQLLGSMGHRSKKFVVSDNMSQSNRSSRSGRQKVDFAISSA